MDTFYKTQRLENKGIKNNVIVRRRYDDEAICCRNGIRQPSTEQTQLVSLLFGKDVQLQSFFFLFLEKIKETKKIQAGNETAHSLRSPLI